ncbi:MAG: hypothetical protein QOJ58_4471, partial [Alphaproteobacteria bacterium]|nr:hypothetical protein [Alphaproteobacteria bacterium]
HPSRPPTPNRFGREDHKRSGANIRADTPAPTTSSAPHQAEPKSTPTTTPPGARSGDHTQGPLSQVCGALSTSERVGYCRGKSSRFIPVALPVRRLRIGCQRGRSGRVVAAPPACGWLVGTSHSSAGRARKTLRSRRAAARQTRREAVAPPMPPKAAPPPGLAAVLLLRTRTQGSGPPATASGQAAKPTGKRADQPTSAHHARQTRVITGRKDEKHPVNTSRSTPTG